MKHVKLFEEYVSPSDWPYKAIEMCESGMVSWEDMARMAIWSMAPHDVMKMLYNQGLMQQDDDEE